MSTWIFRSAATAPSTTRSAASETFRRLVHDFYAGVAEDPVLRPLYPEQDLAGAEERLRMFLEQYWGGPRTYSEQRGPPAAADAARPVRGRPGRARDAWLRHMRAAVDSLDLPPTPTQLLWDYLVMAAAQHGEPVPD